MPYLEIRGLQLGLWYGGKLAEIQKKVGIPEQREKKKNAIHFRFCNATLARIMENVYTLCCKDTEHKSWMFGWKNQVS